MSEIVTRRQWLPRRGGDGRDRRTGRPAYSDPPRLGTSDPREALDDPEGFRRVPRWEPRTLASEERFATCFETDGQRAVTWRPPSGYAMPVVPPRPYPHHAPVSVSDAVDADRRARDEFGLPSVVLMEHAAR